MLPEEAGATCGNLLSKKRDDGGGEGRRENKEGKDKGRKEKMKCLIEIPIL